MRAKSYAGEFFFDPATLGGIGGLRELAG